MGILQAFGGAVGGTFGDLWKDFFTVEAFDELEIVRPGVQESTNRGRGSNYRGSEGIITNGSRIYVPENTAAFIFGQGEIENVITEPGEYEYQGGEDTVFDGGSVDTIFDQVKDRFGYGGMLAAQKRIAFVNLREIRGVKFGTKGPQLFNDQYYKADLELVSHGVFSVKVTDPTLFVRNFLPANTSYYSFADPDARTQLVAEFLQSYMVAIGEMSSKVRVADLPANATRMAQAIRDDTQNAGTWPERLGLQLMSVGIEAIRLTEESRATIDKFNQARVSVSAYEEVTPQAADVAARQKIASGVEAHGLGDAGGMMLGVDVARQAAAAAAAPAPEPEPAPAPDPRPDAASEPTPATEPAAAPAEKISRTEQIALLKEYKELLDAGALTQEEFDSLKSDIFGF